MPLKNFRQIFMPYCLDKQADGSWLVLNRDYKPVGFRTRAHVTYKDYPIAVHLKKLTPAVLAKVSYEPIGDDPSRVWLYSDGCLPNESPSNMQAYFKRLSYLMDLEADGETPPGPPRDQGHLADYPKFLRSLLDGSAGGSYNLTEPTTGKLKLTAVNLATFQTLVHEIRAHAGDGYKVIKIHESADHPGQMVDMVLLQLQLI